VIVNKLKCVGDHLLGLKAGDEGIWCNQKVQTEKLDVAGCIFNRLITNGIRIDLWCPFSEMVLFVGGKFTFGGH